MNGIMENRLKVDGHMVKMHKVEALMVKRHKLKEHKVHGLMVRGIAAHNGGLLGRGG